jgi:hypothetical protein
VFAYRLGQIMAIIPWGATALIFGPMVGVVGLLVQIIGLITIIVNSKTFINSP